MKYRISFRELNESNINNQCPFLPEADEFGMYLQAITQDINGLAGVTDVSAHEVNNLIVTTRDVDLQTLKAELKPLFQQYFQYLRSSAIVETL